MGEPVTGDILAEAHAAVHGDRQQDYGPPALNHQATADLWAAYLHRRFGVRLALDGRDVCWLNILQKASRDAHRPKRDNARDTIGYAENMEREEVGCSTGMRSGGLSASAGSAGRSGEPARSGSGDGSGPA